MRLTLFEFVCCSFVTDYFTNKSELFIGYFEKVSHLISWLSWQSVYTSRSVPISVESIWFSPQSRFSRLTVFSGSHIFVYINICLYIGNKNQEKGTFICNFKRTHVSTWQNIPSVIYIALNQLFWKIYLQERLHLIGMHPSISAHKSDIFV